MALRLRSKCDACAHRLGTDTLRCPNCGHLQELPPGASHFEVLGVPETLGFDPEALRARFHLLARQTHPDRFVAASPPQALLAARWSTALNQAYQLLRDPIQRAMYLLQRQGFAELKPSVPVELSEAYFDLQDLVSEGQNRDRLLDFQKQMEARRQTLDGEWNTLAQQWDAQPDKKLAAPVLAKHLTLRRFLLSLLADIEKKVNPS